VPAPGCKLASRQVWKPIRVQKIITKEIFRTPALRYQLAVSAVVLLGTFAFAAVYPHDSAYLLLVFALLWLPGPDYPMDLLGAMLGPMLIASASGSSWAYEPLAFNLKFTLAACLITSAMGFFAGRLVAKAFNQSELKSQQKRLD
jgi:hypothetical protein